MQSDRYVVRPAPPSAPGGLGRFQIIDTVALLRVGELYDFQTDARDAAEDLNETARIRAKREDEATRRRRMEDPYVNTGY